MCKVGPGPSISCILQENKLVLACCRLLLVYNWCTHLCFDKCFTVIIKQLQPGKIELLTRCMANFWSRVVRYDISSSNSSLISSKTDTSASSDSLADWRIHDRFAVADVGHKEMNNSKPLLWLGSMYFGYRLRREQVIRVYVAYVAELIGKVKHHIMSQDCSKFTCIQKKICI